MFERAYIGGVPSSRTGECYTRWLPLLHRGVCVDIDQYRGPVRATYAGKYKLHTKQRKPLNR